jgi:HTH-type transcriptional regulator/antitoxin HigA
VIIKPIRCDEDLRRAFRCLEKVFQTEEGTPQADERDVLVKLIEAYENKHYDFGRADPVEAIMFRIQPFNRSGATLQRIGVILAGRCTGTAGSMLRASGGWRDGRDH